MDCERGDAWRRPTAWDNPAHSSEHRSGRPMSTCDNGWGRLEGRGYSATPRLDQVRFEQPRYDTPRLDQLRFEQPRYEKMKAPRFDGSDAANVNFAATTRTDGAGGFLAAGGFELVSPDSVSSDGCRLPDDASHLLGSSDVEGVDEGRIVVVPCDSKCLPKEKTGSIANAGLKAGDAMPELDANLTGIQKVECVKQEATSMYLLSCFQKPSPPVPVLCGNKSIEEFVVKWSYKAEWRHSTIPLCAKQ
ncbi:hypothetical protein SASPL_136187 [Salvia splendens]|uniref:Uncharacterized protein n=1 Tax=Salvia splendens TaxID=180675 RepID=A0A8X8X1J3_SALSN|nr:hypothetical protein SASPL_136187 [Salvia splendens]